VRGKSLKYMRTQDTTCWRFQGTSSNVVKGDRGLEKVGLMAMGSIWPVILKAKHLEIT
jgi:hypothetical protein